MAPPLDGEGVGATQRPCPCGGLWAGLSRETRGTSPSLGLPLPCGPSFISTAFYFIFRLLTFSCNVSESQGRSESRGRRRQRRMEAECSVLMC